MIYECVLIYTNFNRSWKNIKERCMHLLHLLCPCASVFPVSLWLLWRPLRFMIFAFAFLFIIFVLMASSTSSLAKDWFRGCRFQKSMVGFDVNIFTDTFWLNSRCSPVSQKIPCHGVTAALQTTDKIEAKHYQNIKKKRLAVMRSDGAR